MCGRSGRSPSAALRWSRWAAPGRRRAAARIGPAGRRFRLSVGRFDLPVGRFDLPGGGFGPAGNQPRIGRTGAGFRPRGRLLGPCWLVGQGRRGGHPGGRNVDRGRLGGRRGHLSGRGRLGRWRSHIGRRGGNGGCRYFDRWGRRGWCLLVGSLRLRRGGSRSGHRLGRLLGRRGRLGTWPAALGLWLFRLLVATEPLPVRLAANPVGLGIFNARRVALDPDTETEAEIQRFFVGKAELACQLVDPNLLGQLLDQSLSTGGHFEGTAVSILARIPIASRSAIPAPGWSGAPNARLNALRRTA